MVANLFLRKPATRLGPPVGLSRYLKQGERLLEALYILQDCRLH
jgi:hypothetical protein